MKGQIQNYFAVILFVFVFGFLSILGMTLYTAQADAFNSTGLMTTEMQNAADDFETSYKLYDYIIVIILLVLIVGIILTSYKLNTSPVFFVISLTQVAFYTLVSYVMNHMFYQMISESVFTATLVYFPKTLILCTNLHWIALVIFIVGSIALYAKKESESDIQGGAF